MPGRDSRLMAEGRMKALAVPERRADVRSEAAFDVQLSMTSEAGNKIQAEAWVRDISAHGLGVCCSQEFAVGDIVSVRAPGRNLRCEVRHTRPEGEVFAMGLKLLNTSGDGASSESLVDLSQALEYSIRTANI